MDAVVVFDCGSTNLRVAVIDQRGSILAQASKPNSPSPQPGHEEWLIWDVDQIWHKLCSLSRTVMKLVDSKLVKAVAVTTWGADGALVKRDGSLAYPAISWQCSRTRTVVKEVVERVEPREIFSITGYQVIYFNTLFKLLWIRRNAPKAFERAYTWLMMPGLIAHRLSGEFHIDPTSASTMMAMDLARRDWSPEMLEIVNLDPSFFPEWREPGEVVGYVTEEACRATGIPENTPVIAAGHDTQFAIMAAGASEGEAVLSSGTWEILGLRLDRFDPNDRAFEEGVIIEADVEPGLWNPQLLMIASAVLEWVKRLLYPELGPGEYEEMLREAMSIPPGSNGVIFIPSFVRDSGPTRKYGTKGTILGLELGTTRAHLYRAAVEGLSLQLRLALEILEEAFSFKARGVRVVGGGSKNELWNMIRAEVLGIPVTTTRFAEATILGAALTAFKGIGVFKSLREALQSLDWRVGVYEPSGIRVYEKLYRDYKTLLQTLKHHYLRKWLS
ncbi:MAG: L-fuculokinase [Thermoprotei archaeon]|nr:MAG: L-fuculokinase [Thermoprotei archaeon]